MKQYRDVTRDATLRKEASRLWMRKWAAVGLMVGYYYIDIVAICSRSVSRRLSLQLPVVTFASGYIVTESIRKVNPEVWSSVVVGSNGEVDPSLESILNTTCSYNTEGNSTNSTSVRPIVLSHPQSIDPDDKYYEFGGPMQEATHMMVDYINNVRCGVRINGQRYPIELHTYEDRSDPNLTEAIGTYIATSNISKTVPRTDFMLAGYSATLTRLLTPISEANGLVLVSGGTSNEDVFMNKSLAFGILLSSRNTLDRAVEITSLHGAKTIAAIYEDPLVACNPVTELAEKFNMEAVMMYGFPKEPNASLLDEAVYNISSIDPDVVVACMYPEACVGWIEAMRRSGWSPRAQIFAVCIGSPLMTEQVPVSDLSYMMGAASWHKIIEPKYPDAITNWTPLEFSDRFLFRTSQEPAYQHTAAAAAVSVLIQAIEMAGTLDSQTVAQVLSNNTFYTVYGETFFNENGQNVAPSFLLQHDAQNGDLHVVSFGNDDVSSNSTFKIIYPMPSWKQRDCEFNERCVPSGGSCDNVEGTCNCTNATGDTETNNVISWGLGSTAFCKVIVEEDMNWISDPWIGMGIAFVSIQTLLSLSFAIGTYRCRKNPVIQASQPIFLILIAFGCFVLALSIVPTMIQGGYRYKQDPQTGQLLLDEPNPDIRGLDAACMAFPWLSGIGFVTVYSALFAKIWRVKKLLANAERFRRKTVAVQDVAMIMVVMLSFEVIVLIVWQIVSPLRWERDVLTTDSDGFPLESVGSCSSTHQVAFSSTLGGFYISSLVYALYLCFITRNVPSDFAEGTFITISVASAFQILTLAIPVLVIAADDPNATYFVTAAIVFLVSSTITLLIFGPKFWRIWRAKKDGINLAASMTARRSNFSTSNVHPNSQNNTSSLNFNQSGPMRVGERPNGQNRRDMSTSGTGNSASQFFDGSGQLEPTSPTVKKSTLTGSESANPCDAEIIFVKESNVNSSQDEPNNGLSLINETEPSNFVSPSKEDELEK